MVYKKTHSLVGVHSWGGKPDGYICPAGKPTGGSTGGLVAGICSDTGGDGRLVAAGLLCTVTDAAAVAMWDVGIVWSTDSLLLWSCTFKFMTQKVNKAMIINPQNWHCLHKISMIKNTFYICYTFKSLWKLSYPYHYYQLMCSPDMV